MVMIPSDVGIQVRNQTEAGSHSVRSIGDIPSDLPEFQQGQPFRARIQEVLPENTYKALVAGRLMTLSLPEGAKAGDTLDLVVVGRTRQAIIAQRGALSADADLAPFENATISRTGQLIGSLLGSEGERPPPANLSRGGPVLANVPANAAELARELPPNLARAVAGSGMFYEAHQVQWALGQRPLASLVAEPQGRFSHPALLRAIAAGEEGLPPAEPHTPGATTPSPADLQQALAWRSLAGVGAPGDDVASAAVAPAPTMPEELRPLVQQQLEAGASNRLLWQGEIWPRQTMDWEIRREEQRAADTSEPQDVWQTRLRLNLPRLGEIEVRLQINGSSVNVLLDTPEVASRSKLEAALPGLQQSFSASGLTLAGAQVKRESV